MSDKRSTLLKNRFFLNIHYKIKYQFFLTTNMNYEKTGLKS